MGASFGEFGIVSNFSHLAACPATVDEEPGWVDTYTGEVDLAGPSIGLKGGADVIIAFHDFGTNPLSDAR